MFLKVAVWRSETGNADFAQWMKPLYMETVLWEGWKQKALKDPFPPARHAMNTTEAQCPTDVHFSRTKFCITFKFLGNLLLISEGH